MSDNESVLSSLSSSSENPEGAGAGAGSVRVKVEEAGDMDNPATTTTTTLLMSKKQRRFSMDEGSDLSALTSEVDDDELLQQRLRDRQASTASSVASASSSQAAPSSAASAAPSASSSRRSSSSTTRLRARGRPPTKRNALAAAAKRQASKSRNNRMDLDEPEDPALERYDQVDETGERANASSRSPNATSAHHNIHSLDTAAVVGSAGSDSPVRTEADGQLSLEGRKYTPDPIAANGQANAIKSVQRQSTSPRQKQRNDSAQKLHPEEADHVLQQQANNVSTSSLTNGSSVHELDVPDEEDETSEAEQRMAPLPPAIDNSSDEDYEEHLRKSAGKQRRATSNSLHASSGSGSSLKGVRKGVTAGKKAAAARARAAAAAQRSEGNGRLVSPNGQLDGGKEDYDIREGELATEGVHALSTPLLEHGEGLEQHSDAGDHVAPDTARIVVTDTAALDNEVIPGHLEYNRISSHPMAALDTEDAMSAVSDDTPLLFKAAARAQDHRDKSTLSRIPVLSINDLYQGESADLNEPSTPLNHAVSPPPSSRGRGKSPAAGRGRGRGRGGRGKRAMQQQRLLDLEDHDASAASATEDAPLEGVRDGSPHPDTPAASDHEEETADATVSKKRNEALEALTRIEISFAQLRDRLFLERMEEVARERWQIESGTHPELLHLIKVIEHRRSARLELARRMLAQTEASIVRQDSANLRADWYDWARERSDLRKSMMDEAYIKKRKLEREKRSIERPRSEDLATILRMHAPPHYLYYEKKPAAAYRASYSAEYDIADGLARKRKLGAVGLDHEEALYDLERMGLRDPYSSGYQPGMYDAPFGAGHLPASANDHKLGTFGHQFQHPLAAQGRTVASVPQQGLSGRADLFGGYRAQANAAALAQSSQLSRPTLDDHLASSAGQPQNRAQYVKDYFAGRIPALNGGSL